MNKMWFGYTRYCTKSEQPYWLISRKQECSAMPRGWRNANLDTTQFYILLVRF